MNKPINFTQAEREVLLHFLAHRLEIVAADNPDLLKNEKSRAYKNYVGSVKSALDKISQSETCLLTSWERISCHSVLNGEYQSLTRNPFPEIPYNKELHLSVIAKCKV